MGQSRRPGRYIDVITCNGYGCYAIVTEGVNKTVREIAYSLGWKNNGPVWLCKDCQKKEKGEAAR